MGKMKKVVSGGPLGAMAVPRTDAGLPDTAFLSRLRRARGEIWGQPEIQSIREPQEPNGSCHGWVESAPRNISDSNGLSEYGESNSEPIKRIAGSGRGRRYIQNRVDQGESTQTFGQHYLSCCYSRCCRRKTMTEEKDDGY